MTTSSSATYSQFPAPLPNQNVHYVTPPSKSTPEPLPAGTNASSTNIIPTFVPHATTTQAPTPAAQGMKTGAVASVAIALVVIVAVVVFFRMRGRR